MKCAIVLKSVLDQARPMADGSFCSRWDAAYVLGEEKRLQDAADLARAHVRSSLTKYRNAQKALVAEQRRLAELEKTGKIIPLLE